MARTHGHGVLRALPMRLGTRRQEGTLETKGWGRRGWMPPGCVWVGLQRGE